MPIERIPVVHKFGIISRTHQEEIQQRILEKDAKRKHVCQKGPRSAPNSTPNSSLNNSHENLEQLIYQLQNETEDLVLSHHEMIAKNELKKIQFKLATMDKRNTVETLKHCWKDLSYLVTCKHPRILEETLRLLKESLVIAPLSKQIVKSLLDIGLCHLQALLMMEDDEVKTKRYSNNQLLVETTFLLFKRLYYHHMASDLIKTEYSHQLEGLYLINKGLDKLKETYESKPTIWMHILGVRFIVELITKNAAGTVEQFLNTIEKDDRDKNEVTTKQENSNEKLSQTEDDTTHISTLLWNTLSVWKSISRQSKLSNFVVEDIRNYGFQPIDCHHPEWMEAVLSLEILSECAKVKMEYLLLLIKIGPSSKSTKKTEYTWPISLQFFYLKCLANIGTHGMTTEIVSQALLGDRNNNDGLASFLQRSGDEETSWRIRQATYQLLYDTYILYKNDPLKEVVCNALWHILDGFMVKEKNAKVVAINKIQCKDEVRCNEDTLLKKIATNFSIIYLPLENDRRRKDPKKERTKPHTPKQSGGGGSKKKYDVQPKIDGQNNRQRTQTSEETSWEFMKSIVDDHYSEEVNESEAQVIEIRRNLQDLGLVKEELEMPCSATLADSSNI